jgi:hypothetical protein
MIYRLSERGLNLVLVKYPRMRLKRDILFGMTDLLG